MNTTTLKGEGQDLLGTVKQAAGEATNVTGVDAPYEHPLTPELHLPTSEMPAEESARKVLAMLLQAGILSS